MFMSRFKPHHINATQDDLAGNHGIGRYIFLPGSEGRAKAISQHFNNLTVNTHPRGHNLYLGTIADGKKTIDVASIASGMGCPSMEIILHELFHLGGKRFLRVGTAGSLQPEWVKLEDIINAQATVRDESTSIDYMPLAVPAIASIDCTIAILHAAKKLGLVNQVHTGTVHCKSSLYAREFGAGPQGQSHQSYMNLLTQCGVLATEMETSTLFIQSQRYNYQLSREGTGAQYRVLCGAILGIIATPPNHFVPLDAENTTMNNVINMALEAVKTLSDRANEIG